VSVGGQRSGVEGEPGLKYTAVHRAFMLGDPMVDAPIAAQGAWLRLQSYAASDGVESPVIVGAAGWTDRRWVSLVQLERVDVDQAVAAGLARWSGGDLEVIGFDAPGLRAVATKRTNGKFGALGGRPRKDAKPSGLSEGNPAGNPVGKKSKTPSPISSLPLLSFPEADSSELGCADSKPPVFVFPSDVMVGTDSGPWAVTHEFHERLMAAFPGVQVAIEYPRALAWLAANRRKRKTHDGMPRFLNTWMANEQNAGRASSGPNGQHLRALPPLATKLDTRV
jgi:hypothetical protein